MDAQQGKWVVYHLHGETSLSMVCGNGRQKKKRFGNLPFTQKKTQKFAETDHMTMSLI